MTSSVSKLQPIEGLSKRELSKLERLMKREEFNKTKSDGKTYKRKASKTSHPLESQPRKLAPTEQTVNEPQSEQKSISMASLAKVQGSPGSVPQVKKTIVTLKPFNSDFQVQGGQDGLFTYLMSYVMAQKQKQLEAEYIDLAFLDTLEGNELEIVSRPMNKIKQIEIKNKTELEKTKIKQPFDKAHKDLLRKMKASE